MISQRWGQGSSVRGSALRPAVQRRILTVCIAIAMLAVLVLPGPARHTEAALLPRVHAAVYSWAQANPGQLVPVIVQTYVNDGQALALVSQRGGIVSRSFPFIKAFAAAVPATSLDILGLSPSVRWVSFDAGLRVTAEPVDASTLATTFPRSVAADQAWKPPTGLTGRGITVAVLDTGISPSPDLYSGSTSRIVASYVANPRAGSSADGYGHGTHVAGIIAGNGARSDGKYIGIAPQAHLVNVKVSDDTGKAQVSDALAGLQWVYENRARYTIRVVNMSLTSTVPQSYLTDPLNAAVEELWFSGVVVVVAAGNRGGGFCAVCHAPANDPYVITVGAVDEHGTATTADDTRATWSSYGQSIDGASKPDLVAPGSRIVSLLAGTTSVLATKYPQNIADQFYFRMGGTSMAAPIVAGAVALILQDEPMLSPDQVKQRLMSTATSLSSAGVGRGEVNIWAAVTATRTGAANGGLLPSLGFNPATGTLSPDGVSWDGVSWDGVSWDGVSWDNAVPE